MYHDSIAITNSDILPVSNSRHRRNQVLLLLSIGAIVFLSRLPFLGAGYGNDPDAWRAAAVARSIGRTGEYSASRFPGYPVQEAFYSVIWQGGPLALNGATAFLSSLGALFFSLSMKRLGYRYYILAGLALAFTPVVYINSTNSMDYIWALTFILGSLYFALAGRQLIAGVFLGIAIGCRITSGAMLVPLSLLLVRQHAWKHSARRILVFALCSCFVGGIIFVPVFLKYGWSFFMFWESGYPPILDVVKRASIEVWGRIGLFAILVAVVSIILQMATSRKQSAVLTSTSKSHTLAWVLAVGLYLIAYLRLPHESGYLVPVVPFVFLLLGKVLDQRFFIALCITMLLSPFISTSEGSISYGPLLANHLNRVEQMEFTEQVLSIAADLPGKSVVVAGPRLPQIEGTLPLNHSEAVEYVYELNATQLESYLKKDFKVYYLPGIRWFVLQRNDVDLHERGATPLIR